IPAPAGVVLPRGNTELALSDGTTPPAAAPAVTDPQRESDRMTAAAGQNDDGSQHDDDEDQGGQGAQGAQGDAGDGGAGDGAADLGDKGKQALDRMKAERNRAREELKAYSGLGLPAEKLRELIDKSAD